MAEAERCSATPKTPAKRVEGIRVVGLVKWVFRGYIRIMDKKMESTI